MVEFLEPVAMKYIIIFTVIALIVVVVDNVLLVRQKNAERGIPGNICHIDGLLRIVLYLPRGMADCANDIQQIYWGT
ncbi:MAG: hypothetical protein WCU00_04190 [Candidatus Latescibacterota bacterium]|jgi:hypothetical protein